VPTRNQEIMSRFVIEWVNIANEGRKPPAYPLQQFYINFFEVIFKKMIGFAFKFDFFYFSNKIVKFCYFNLF